jgi:predicted ArsR family transcriptional regulator
MSLESEKPRRRLLDDPVAIRAYAHPVRLELQALLGREGPMTAAEAGRRLGISQALASHHLRLLAKYDFVEPVPGKDNRERPWRVISTSHSWREAMGDPDTAAAAEVLEQIVAERALEQFLDWLPRRKDAAEPWRSSTGVSQNGVYLTAEELSGVVKSIRAVIQPYIDQRPIDDKSTRPEGSRLVDLTYFVSVVETP